MIAFDVLTFDCYGTLVDWDSGISSALIGAARADGVSLERDSVLEAYHDAEVRLEAESWRPYRDVLAEAAVSVAGRFGWPLTLERARFLPESLPGWPPFPDTVPALERLAREGVALGILSNVDDDLLAGTRRRLGAPFEFAVTAGQVRSYKPSPAHFERGREHAGSRRWLHVAQSLYHDIEPAHRLGIPAAWVNRKGEHRGKRGAPAYEAETLGGLVEILAGSRGA